MPLLALTERGDAWHARSRDVQLLLTRDATPLLMSEWVLTEYLNACSRPPLRQAACRVIQRLEASSRTEIVHATHAAWTAAREFFESRQDKEWSLVDCASMLLCHERGIRRVFTHDHHFMQAGFEILLA